MTAKLSRFTPLSCFVLFLLAGIIYSQITARMPALKAHANIDEAGVGIVLACMGAGSFIGFASIPFLLKAFSSRLILTISAFACLILFFVTALATNLLFLGIVFALIGTFFACYEVCLNTQILNLETQSGKNYMLKMHAAYNVGSLTGSLSGAVFAFFAIGITGNFSAVAAFFILPTIFCVYHLLPDLAPSHLEGRNKFTKIPLFVIFCGILALCAYTIEGSIAEWGGLVMHQEKGASESLAALVYGCFSFITALTRFNGERLRLKFGDFNLLFFGSIIAFIGMSLVIFVPSPYVTLFGYAICGIGLAPLVPIVLSKVGHRSDIAPATASTVISMFGYSGILVVPPSLGFLANHFGLLNALFLPLGLICIVALGAITLRKYRG